MRIDIITIFPEMLGAIQCCGIPRRAIETGALDLNLWNPRDLTEDSYNRVDDRPYGGGPGMVMLADPLKRTLDKARQKNIGGRVIYLTPQGAQLTQDRIYHLATARGLIFLAGRYEGVDQRLIDQEVDEEISIGDYVLSGGELPAMVLIESLARCLPGVLGNQESVREESFSEGLLDWPQYTRPEKYCGLVVPSVLLGGDHGAIRKWRLQQALGRTWKRRPDLIAMAKLNEEQEQLLHAYQKEHKEKESLR